MYFVGWFYECLISVIVGLHITAGVLSISSVHRFVWPPCTNWESKSHDLALAFNLNPSITGEFFSLTIQRPNSISGDQLMKFVLNFENRRRVNKTLNKNRDCLTISKLPNHVKKLFKGSVINVIWTMTLHLCGLLFAWNVFRNWFWWRS